MKIRFGIVEFHNDFEAFADSIDILSIHMPATEKTYDFFNQNRLYLLRKGTSIINTSRGNLIDENALYDAVKDEHIAAAALDVFKEEPYKPDNTEKDLRNLDNIILSPHVASNTLEANKRMQENIISNIELFYKAEYDQMTLVK